MEQSEQMIFILSANFDRSTDEVLKYLLVQKERFIRVNDTDLINFFQIKLDNSSEVIEFQVADRSINFADIKS